MGLFAILLRRDVLFAFVVLIIGPFLTFFITTLIFYQRARSKTTKKIPPTVPFFVPGIFHAFSLVTAGPQAYFAQLLKECGQFAPFIVRIGPKPYLLLREPKHISKALKAAEHFDPVATHVDILDKIFGMPESATKLFLRQEDQASSTSPQLAMPADDLDRTATIVLAETYVSILSNSLNDKMFQFGTWTQIEDLWSFLQQVISRCMIETLFGTDLIKQHRSVIRDFWKFSEAAEDFLPGMPRYMVTSAASAAQEEMHKSIEKWIKANHSGSEFARIRPDDPDWDALRGSRFIQERDDLLSKTEGVDTKARVADLLNIMHSALADLVPSTIWSLFEILRRPQVAKDVTTGISRYRPSQDATYNVAGIAELSLIQSIQAEIRRLRMATVVVRTGSNKNFELDQNWSIPPNTSMIAFTSDIALDTEAWTKARPSTTKRPLEEFWAERFVAQGGVAAKMSNSGTRDTAGRLSFSRNGLDDLLIGDGEHPHQNLGPEYASKLHAATLALLFGGFEIEFCDPEAFDAAIPPTHEVAYGTNKPLGPIAVRIRKRSTA